MLLPVKVFFPSQSILNSLYDLNFLSFPPPPPPPCTFALYFKGPSETKNIKADINPGVFMKELSSGFFHFLKKQKQAYKKEQIMR